MIIFKNKLLRYNVILFLIFLNIYSCSKKNNPISSLDSKIYLISYKGIVKNGMLDTADSVLLVFNEPISVLQIKSNDEYCDRQILCDYILENRVVRFSYDCARLG
jgi:hypothetical protein